MSRARTGPAPRPARARRQGGIAAVELAFILPLLVVLLQYAWAAGQLFREYTVLLNATHNAARYLAAQPPYVLMDGTRGLAAAATARQMVRAAAAAAAIVADPTPFNVRCGVADCGGALPATVRVFFSVDVQLLFYYGPLSFDVSVPYAH